MYLSYYKRPELTIFDEDECKEFGRKYLKDFWKVFQYRDPYVYKDGELVEQTDKERKLSLLSVSSQLNTEIGMGAVARRVENIYYISKSFREAMSKCIGKILPLTNEKDIYLNIHENCCIIDDDSTFVLMSTNDNNARMIHIFNAKVITVTDFRLTAEGIDNIESLSFLDLESPLTVGINMEKYREITKGENEELQRLKRFYLYLLFKKYGNINIETVFANKTLKKSQILGEKVNNFMGVDVQVLDSRWFTTICRDEGFLVSGHFRLQPCKDEQGEWTRKLIYINPYAKHGYHRLAPIVNLEGNESK